MSLPRLLTRTVDIVQQGPGTPDRYNEATVSEIGRETVKAHLEQVSSQEILVDRDTVVSDWLAVFDAGTAIDAGDRVEAEEGIFEVVGAPSRPHTRRGEHHVEARLRFISDDQSEQEGS